MASSAVPRSDLGSLFVAVTGRSTVVERRRPGVTHRPGDERESAVLEYLRASVRADGLDDAIADPDPN